MRSWVGIREHHVVHLHHHLQTAVGGGEEKKWFFFQVTKKGQSIFRISGQVPVLLKFKTAEEVKKNEVTFGLTLF